MDAGPTAAPTLLRMHPDTTRLRTFTHPALYVGVVFVLVLLRLVRRFAARGSSRSGPGRRGLVPHLRKSEANEGKPRGFVHEERNRLSNISGYLNTAPLYFIFGT